MKSHNIELKKVSGGFGFASSMIRSNAPTKHYINHIVYVIDKNLFRDENVMEYTIDGDEVNIYLYGKEIFSCTLKDVEKYRDISINEFEKRIIISIEEKGIHIDKENEYYIKIKG